MNVEIFNYLLQCAKANEKVMLYNTYKGIPITFEAEFIKISHGVIDLKVHKYQALCIQHSQRTLIKHDIFLSYPCSTLKCEFSHLIVSLYEFTYADDRVAIEKVWRVAPG
jgi:hypothetical protein